MINSDFVTFVADGALYAVPVARVQEILDVQPVAAMPNAPPHLLGITDLRGENIPVVDLRILLGRAALEDTPQTRILVVWISNGADQTIIGVRTDRVIEVTQLDDGELRSVGQTDVLRWGGKAIAGIGRRNGAVITVLDLDNLFSVAPLDTHIAPALPLSEPTYQLAV
jgi:purine-binding chemotaxis protein CheW